MKYKLTFLAILTLNFIFSQQLTIDETIDYINSNLNDEFKLQVSKDRNFKIYQDKSSNQYWIDFNNKLNNYFPNRSSDGTSFGEQWSYSGKIDKVSLGKNIDFKNDFILEFQCKESSPCYYVSGRKYEVRFKNNNIESKNAYLIPNSDQNKYKFELTFQTETKRDKIYNAFRYLVESIKMNEDYQNQDSDPFSNENFKTLYSYITGTKSKDEIQLKSNNGTYLIFVSINGLKSNFVLDSGASEISISSNFERELIARGLIKKEDYLEQGLYKIANGTIVTQRRINLREVKVGDFTVKNVTASVGNGDIPLLLGKSFLDKFSKWSIDNNTEKLILEK